MKTNFKIFPKKGFINSHFTLISDSKDLTITIAKDGEELYEFCCDKGKSITFNLKEEGLYTASSKEGENYIISVKEAWRFGSSILKKSYVFDDLDYSLFVMMDRLRIYDEKTKILYEENGISPTEIFRFSTSHVIFRTERGGNDLVNYALYNLSNLTIECEITSKYKDVYVNVDNNTFWLKGLERSEIVLFRLEKNKVGWRFIEKERFIHVVNYEYVKAKDFLFLETESCFYVIKLNARGSDVIQQIDKKDDILFDKNGFHYLLDNQRLIITNLLFDYHFETPFSDPFSVTDELFKGSAFECNDDCNNDDLIEQFILNKKGSKAKVFFNYCDDDPTMVGSNIFNFKINDKVYTLFPGNEIIHLVLRTTSSTYSCRYDQLDSSHIMVFTNTTYIDEIYTINDDGVWKLDEAFIDDKLTGLSFLFPSLIYDDDNNLTRDSQVQHIRNKRLDCLIVTHPTNHSHLLQVNIEGEHEIVKDKMKILNSDFIEEHDTIWYKSYDDKKLQPSAFGENHGLYGYNINLRKDIIISNTEYPHLFCEENKTYDFFDEYILSSNNIIIHPQTGEIKHSVPGIIDVLSKSLNKVLSTRESHIYLSHFNQETRKYEEVEVPLIDGIQYEEAFLSPDGKHFIYKESSDEYCFYDFINDRKVNFFSGTFLEFSSEGNLIFEEKSQRAALIIDPLTQENITPAKYQYYRFISPDRKIFSQVAISNDRLFSLDGSIQSLAAVNRFIELYGLRKDSYKTDPNTNDKQDWAMIKARKQYFNSNSTLIARFNKNDSNNQILNWEDINYWTLFDEFIELGIVGTDTSFQLVLPKELWFFNYAAFSYDSKYFAWVGKPGFKYGSGGYIGLYKVSINRSSNSLELTEQFLSTFATKATWTCGFSKSGYFGTSDSSPISYFLDYENRIDFDQTLYPSEIKKEIRNDHNKTSYSSYSKNGWTLEIGKSFLCFSPSGKYVAMSSKGYDPILSGGVGHLESSDVFIKNISTDELIYVDSIHGCSIKHITGSFRENRNILFVAFSKDETRLMTMSEDGVIVVRNILY